MGGRIPRYFVVIVAIDKLELLLECRVQLRLLGDFDSAVADDDDDDDELVGEEEEDGATTAVTEAPLLEVEAGIRRVAPPLLIIIVGSLRRWRPC